jgi:hypothetical protein
VFKMHSWNVSVIIPVYTGSEKSQRLGCLKRSPHVT